MLDRNNISLLNSCDLTKSEQLFHCAKDIVTHTGRAIEQINGYTMVYKTEERQMACSRSWLENLLNTEYKYFTSYGQNLMKIRFEAILIGTNLSNLKDGDFVRGIISPLATTYYEKIIEINEILEFEGLASAEGLLEKQGFANIQLVSIFV